MKKFFALFFILFTSSLISNAQNARKAFKQLSEMEGLWKMTTAKGFIIEEWKKSNNIKMVGKSYMVKNTVDTVLLEEVLLHRIKKEIKYIPTVMDQNDRQPIPFKLIENRDGKFVFENKEHDFPQRIIYNITDPKKLHVRIEGSKNGVFKFSDFNY